MCFERERLTISTQRLRVLAILAISELMSTIYKDWIFYFKGEGLLFVQITGKNRQKHQKHIKTKP